MIVRGRAPGAYETLDAAGFSNFDFTAFDSFVEGDERDFTKRLTCGANNGEQQQVSALDGSEHAEWTIGVLNWSACRADLISLLKCRESKQRCRCESQLAESRHVTLLRRLEDYRPVIGERRAAGFLQEIFAAGFGGLTSRIVGAWG